MRLLKSIVIDSNSDVVAQLSKFADENSVILEICGFANSMSEAMTLAGGVKGNVAEVFAQNGTCPTNGTNGIATATDIKGKYVDSVTTAGTAAASGGCTITALMSSSTVSKGIQGKNLVLTLSNADKGSNVWTCTSSAEQKYLPKACTGT